MDKLVGTGEISQNHSIFGVQVTANKLAVATSAVASTYVFLREPTKKACTHAVSFAVVVYAVKCWYGRPATQNSNNSALVSHAVRSATERTGGASGSDKLAQS